VSIKELYYDARPTKSPQSVVVPIDDTVRCNPHVSLHLTFIANGPSKTNWEAIRFETYGNQTSRKTKTTMARRCHGRSKKHFIIVIWKTKTTMARRCHARSKKTLYYCNLEDQDNDGKKM